MKATSSLLEIRPPTEDTTKRLFESAKKHHVTVFFPSNILERGGEIIGYVSIGVMPTVHMYFDPEKATSHDYLTAMAYWEGALAFNQAPAFWLPVEGTSALLPFVERCGYEKSNFNNVFCKVLNAKR